MRIIYFHQHFSTPDGSTGTRSFEFSKRLVERGHHVTIICGSYWLADTGLNNRYNNGFRFGSVDGINVIEIDLNYSNSDGMIKRAFIFFKYIISATMIALKLKYDLIFATSTPLTVGIPAIILKLFKKNKPFIFEVRDLWPELPKAMGVINNPIILKALDALENKIYHYSDGCIGLAPGIVDGIKTKVPDKTIIMIPNSCDSHLVKNEILKKKKNNFIAAFTGAHGLANGLEYLLDVAKILKNSEQDEIIIQFIGDGMVKEKLKSEARDNDLRNCQFLDPMPKKQLFVHLKKNVDAGLMVLKNVPEFYNGTSPNKFFDYLSLGLPVINNYPGWVSEIIEKNNCGLVVSPNEPESFVASLIKLKTNPNLVKEMSKNGQKLAQNDFNRNRLSNKFADFILSYESS